MDERMRNLRLKEIISIEEGSRFGYMGDLEIDLETGRIKSLVVRGKLRLFGLLGREEDLIIPWQSVQRIGTDMILVDGSDFRALSKHRNK